MENAKKWYQSKGIWLGILTALIGSIELIRALVESGDFSTAAVVTTVIGVLGIIERAVRGPTNTKLTF